ncbi:GNAT family N-acetyltransferase [Prosthecobacter sp.]|uniref:GNAT family N-acetyltransferase n=1 Tax=Prosthecobacter sp. TaxID=1965333 RepID=UPI003784733F
MTSFIQSERLDLVPLSPEFMRASLRQDLAAAQQQLPARLPAEWPGDAGGLLALRLGQLEADPSYQPWCLRGMCLREAGLMVGYIGFHTAPGAAYLQPYSPRAVEFGFTVFPSFRRHGYAREASQALMNWAHHCHGVSEFILTISPQNTASYALAAQLGFVRIASHIDEVDGLEDILERCI